MPWSPSSLRLPFPLSPRAIPTPRATPLHGWSVPASPVRGKARWLAMAVVLGLATMALTSFAIRTLPWFGPLLADTLRATIGSERVTQLEELVASAEDRVQQVVSDGTVRSLSDATPNELLEDALAPVSVLPTAQRELTPVGPLFSATASREDGAWQRMQLDSGSELQRTILHPDPERAYSELFVFALDLTRVRIHAVAGSIEPRRARASASDAPRPGVVPSQDRDRLVAAFNGGFKAEHGQFGMMVDGTELLAARPGACTFGGAADGSLRIATWSALRDQKRSLSWWRQTPGCMLENGTLHPGLRAEDSRNWGATLEGKTVIRRSAVGLSQDGQTLFVGISNSTTARALALGMQHAGSVHVAQLDVNFSYPRFLVYRREGETLTAVGAVKGLLHGPDEYLGRASTRDFFYITAR